MSNLARTGHGVKSPYKFSCPDIEGADSSAGTFRRMLLQSRSCNNEVLVDGGRRGCLVRSFRPPVRNIRTKVDCSTIAEALARLAGLRIQSEETRIDRGIEDALVHTIRRATTGERRASLPVGSTSILQGTWSAYVAGKGIEYPDFLPGFCLQGNHAAGGRGEVKHPIHH